MKCASHDQSRSLVAGGSVGLVTAGLNPVHQTVIDG